MAKETENQPDVELSNEEKNILESLRQKGLFSGDLSTQTLKTILRHVAQEVVELMLDKLPFLPKVKIQAQITSVIVEASAMLVSLEVVAPLAGLVVSYTLDQCYEQETLKLVAGSLSVRTPGLVNIFHPFCNLIFQEIERQLSDVSGIIDRTLMHRFGTQHLKVKLSINQEFLHVDLSIDKK